MPGTVGAGLIQRSMEGDDVRLALQIRQTMEDLVITPIGTRRIAQQGPDAQRRQTVLQAAAHIAYPNDPYRLIAQREAIALRQHHQGRKNILHHGDGIAAGGGGEADTRLRQPVGVHMIGTGGSRAHKTHRLIGQQRLIDRGHRAHHQRIGPT